MKVDYVEAARLLRQAEQLVGNDGYTRRLIADVYDWLDALQEWEDSSAADRVIDETRRQP